MLHYLAVENFQSVRDEQELFLQAGANPPADATWLKPSWKGSTERAPSVVALFGPNASGKTALLRALAFVRFFVADSFDGRPDAALPFTYFRTAEQASQPSRIALRFAGPRDLEALGQPDAQQGPWAYEVVFRNAPERPSVVAYEAVHYWPKSGKRRARVFERGPDGDVAVAPQVEMRGYRQALEKVLRPNASMISTLAQLNHPLARILRLDALSIKTNLGFGPLGPDEGSLASAFARDEELLASASRELSRLDLGLRGMRVESDPSGPTMLFDHHGLQGPIPMNLQSHGTRSFLLHYPLLYWALREGGIAVIDELDSAIHPGLLPEVLRWFRDPARNPHGAQLWMSCHSASLLEELHKEEVYFCEKGSDGATSVYGLGDVQGVRRDENFYKKYLGGVYGAVPMVG